MKFRISLLALGLAACQTTQPQPDPKPLEAPTPGISPQAITMGLCGGTLGCKLEKVEEVGPAKDGGSLAVYEASVPNPETSDEMVFECRPHRRLIYVVKQRPDPEGESQLLMDLCNQGYGASGLGEDDITLEPGYLTHQQSGGSASRWSRTNVLQLDPVALAKEEHESWHGLMPFHEATSMDWRTLEGEVRSFKAPCDDDGAPDISEDMEILPEFNAAYRLIPLLEQPGIDWSKTNLGACAAQIASDDDQGYVIHGEPGDKGDASMKVLLSETSSTLVVEILDDAFVGEAKSWLYEDHLEIWRGFEGETGDGCYYPSGGMIEQWGITLDTAEVFPAHGKPSVLPTVKRYAFKSGDKDGVRLIITFPPNPGERPVGMTVVYSDSDDGKSQERLIATSHLKFGEPQTLGYDNIIDPKRARCVVKDDTLALELVPFDTPWDSPVLE